MLKQIKELLKPPNPDDVVARELYQARLEHLRALTAREFADSVVTYNARRIQRLTEYQSEREASA